MSLPSVAKNIGNMLRPIDLDSDEKSENLKNYIAQNFSQWEQIVQWCNSLEDYKHITHAMFDDGTVNSGRLSVLCYFTKQVCQHHSVNQLLVDDIRAHHLNTVNRLRSDTPWHIYFLSAALLLVYLYI